uniref:DUF975 family protein n=1 Tax=Agathobacter sp. TaxID=2021311 RepID=UPI004056B7FA
MNRNCKELKRIARENLSTCGYILPMRAFILTSLIVSLFELPFSMLRTSEVLFSTQNIIYYVAQLIISLASILLTCGEYRIHFSIAKHKKAEMKELFFFVKNMPDRYILARFVHFGLTFLCMLPLLGGIVLLYFGKAIIPALVLIMIGAVIAIVFSLTFDLLFFVLIEHPDFSTRQAFTHIRRLMKGNLGKYFYLQLSFLGMMVLVALSFGLAILWVQPYMTQTVTLFYCELTGELDKIEVYKHAKAAQENVFEQYI